MSAAVLRAARADLRARPFQVAVACAAATLSLALGVRGAANGPWDRLHRATNGAHVLASGSDLTSLAGLPGVVATSGPYPLAFAPLARPALTPRCGSSPCRAGCRPSSTRC